MSDPAPLIVTADAPSPAGAEAEWVRGAGGARLRAALFTPSGRTRGSIILSGGRTEPIEKYYETIGDFMERGFVVLAHDWRGQGLSARDLPDRLKGHARGYASFLKDFELVIAAFQERLPRPWVAVGHSMGGCLTLLAMAHGERRFAGAILSAPMLGLKTGKVSPGKARLAAKINVLAGRMARYVQRPRAIEDDFEHNTLTHDRTRYERAAGLLAAEPQLALGGPTWGWLDFAFRAVAYLSKPERLREVTQPVVIVSAEDDTLVDNAAQAAAARHLPQGKLIMAPGAYHEILMETDPMRNIFLRAFDALTGRVAPKPAEAPKLAEAAKPAPAPEPAKAAPDVQAVAPAPAASPAKVKAPAKPKAAPKPKTAKAPAKPATAKVPVKAVAAKAPPKAATKRLAAAKPAAAKAAAAKPAVKAAAKPAAKAPAAKKAPAKPAAAKPAAAPKAAAKKPAARKPAAPKA